MRLLPTPLATTLAIFATAMSVTGPVTSASAQAVDPATRPVQALCDGLISIMKSGKAAGYNGRAATIGPIVDRSFDLPLMTRLAVGTAWNGLSPSDQTALVAAFRRMTIGQYAKSFDGWSGQAFQVDPKVDVRGTDRLVRTMLTSKSGAPIALSYRLRANGGDFRIIDIFYRNSISQLATRRADFERVLATGGAKALIEHLNELATKASY